MSRRLLSTAVFTASFSLTLLLGACGAESDSSLITKAAPSSPAQQIQQSGAAVVAESYAKWKALYVTAQGAGGALRVQRTENENDTVSEGIGYGMLAAVYNNDKATFDGLWQYAKDHFDGNGLMHWRINAQNQIIGYNAATDADEDMAVALIVAAKKFGGKSYDADARTLINNILQHEVEAGSDVIRPGDVWGGSDVTNPSYFAPAYYKVFAAYTQNPRWLKVADATYKILDNVSNYARGAKGMPTGLVPDWCRASGAEAGGMGYDYKYDAFRTPWRLAKDYVWFADARAKKHLEAFNGFLQNIGPQNLRDGYKIDGTVIGKWHNAAVVATAATASLASDKADFRQTMLQEAITANSNNYYNDSLRLLSLMLLTGVMTAP
jgi:endo-1,4-beta-D-glucanase Y